MDFLDDVAAFVFRGGVAFQRVCEHYEAGIRASLQSRAFRSRPPPPREEKQIEMQRFLELAPRPCGLAPVGPIDEVARGSPKFVSPIRAES